MARRPCATRPTHSGVMSLVKTAPGAINASSSSSGSGATKSNSPVAHATHTPRSSSHERDADDGRRAPQSRLVRRLGGVRRVVRDVISKWRRRRRHLRWWIWWIGRPDGCADGCASSRTAASRSVWSVWFFSVSSSATRARSVCASPGVSNASVADGTDSTRHISRHSSASSPSRALSRTPYRLHASVTAYVTRDSAS